MISFFKSLWEGVVVTSFIEWIAVISSILYVILAANRLILCWIFAFIASLLFVYLCYIGQLYVEAILQLFYVVMAIVGWFSWKSLSSDQLEIKKWKSYKHAIAILSSTLAALVIGFTFHKFTNQAHPYIDAFTTCFSLGATYMVTQKILGNWVYWILIDLASIYLYAERAYYLTAFQYALFTILAIYGFISWKNQYKQQNKC